MIKRHLSVFILLMALVNTTKAQVTGLYDATLPWADKPLLHQLPAQYKSSSAVYLLDKRIFHYKIDGQNIAQENSFYKLIKVTDDKGIEMFNKIYLHVGRDEEINNIKARAITSTGKVINITADKIKDQEDDGKMYKIFAMEGLDKGSEIEYSYSVKTYSSYFGSEIFQSRSVPYQQAKVLLIVPKHLKFEMKGYNGFNVLRDSVIGEERLTPGFSENINELDDEKYGLREPYLQRVDFKLSYNLSTNNDVEMYTWKELARKVYTNLTTVTEKEKKAVTKFVAACDIPENASAEKTIQLLEDHLKTKINVDNKLVSNDALNLDAVIKTGNTTDFGACRLFAAMLENKGIKFQAVFPSIRDQLPLDENFADWNRIDEMLIYFPATGKFVQPTATIYRYPIVESYWAGTKGLFLKGTTIGDVKTAVGRFDTIPIEAFEQNAHNMEVSASLDPANSDTLIIESKQILKGYGATSYRPIWTFLPKDKIEETVKSIIGSVGKSESVTNIKAENTQLTDSWDNKPLIISGTIHTAELLEKAGNKILFKIGELIGTQEQMYQEKARQLPAELQYPHVLYRKLQFKIPAGYSIKNLGDLNMDITYKQEERLTLGFTSTYTVTGDMLNIEVTETYADIKYPLSEFETFKKVINAAADFNKIVLVLEKSK